jgi:PHP family Zn ribbon phosphoesterase
VGVLNRVVQLADRQQGYLPKDAVPFTKLVPLTTILSAVRGKGEQTKTIQEEYFRMVRYFGSEFAALEAPKEQLRLASDKEAADAIVNAREGKVFWVPGHDGVFGELSLSRIDKPARAVNGQKSLMDF